MPKLLVLPAIKHQETRLGFDGRCARTKTKAVQLKHTPPKKLTIASRKSRLAMWQAEYVRTKLSVLYPECSIDILGITTQGDRILDRALSSVGGKGLFVKELEVAIAEHRADLAVHSLKDVPMQLPAGFCLSAVLERDDPRDAFVSNAYASLDALPEGAVVGTSSLRRQAMIAARYPGLVIRSLRGNLDTRLGRLDEGKYAAIILAAAGLKRLEMASRIRMFLSPDVLLCAPGQGAMAIETASDREDLAHWLAPLEHVPSAQATAAERTVSRNFGGSCQIPLAAYATLEGDTMRLRAMIASPDGRRIARADLCGLAHAPQELGERIVDLLRCQGAQDILKTCQTGFMTDA